MIKIMHYIINMALYILRCVIKNDETIVVYTLIFFVITNILIIRNYSCYAMHISALCGIGFSLFVLLRVRL